MTAATFDLGTLHGGLRLDANKEAATSGPLRIMPPPGILALPLDQHVGEPAEPIVAIGERVHRGQLLAEGRAALSAPVHAPTSGTITAIEPWPTSRRRGDVGPCIVLEADGEDRGAETPEARPDYTRLDRQQLAALILDGGIVGLGGAVYPTAQKLRQAQGASLDMLILNGVECEPYISCDDTLMRERAAAVVKGTQILLHALDIDLAYIAVESDKPAALEALGDALGDVADDRLVLKQIPTIYPSGAEDQLVQLVTSREVPTRGLPTDVGCLVQNVGTAAAVYDWIEQGEPLVSRITTVTGAGVREPCNVLARIGTPVADIIEFAGGYTDQARHLIVGGPMTGKAMSTDRVPVVKATNCILVLAEPPARGPERPCIRCGECAEVCPIQLLPQQLFWHARADNEDSLREFGLVDCIECGCCDLVCPSNLRLTATYRQAKNRIRELDDEKARARRARRRYEARQERLLSEQNERERELKQQKAAAKKAGPEAIAEIMRRRRRDDN